MNSFFHFLFGCRPGQLLWMGRIANTTKQNNPGLYFRKRRWEVRECSVCRQPCIPDFYRIAEEVIRKTLEGKKRLEKRSENKLSSSPAK